MTSFFKKTDPRVGPRREPVVPRDPNIPREPPWTTNKDVAAPASVAGRVNTSPLPAEKLIANPENPESVTSVRYRPDGTVMPKAEEVPEEDLGPEGMPATSSDEAPFGEGQIPAGWGRFPTAEEVAWLNEKYPVEFNDAGIPVGEVPPGPDLTGTITAFTAASPTEATTDAEDAAALQVGGYVTLEALMGVQASKDLINGQRVLILSLNPTLLDLDLLGVDVTGLTADYVRENAV